MLNDGACSRQLSHIKEESQSLDPNISSPLLTLSKQNDSCSSQVSDRNHSPRQTVEHFKKSECCYFCICNTSKSSDDELEAEIDRMIIDESVIVNGGPATQEKQQHLSFQTYKNLLVISIAFLLQFTAFNGMGNLQSSLNTEANVGVNSLSILYGFLIFSSILLPHPLMAIFGLKWTIIICQIA
ncbi:unnamed protein product [Rotaria sp. Silwood1]|nr:unnamed protein product [Rotaria sp. Silwood1]CAF1633947.1 unnamed protein product [Rotaria sp. Silwood1]CAF3766903.1 unnamed protein product [Rotaria sp. Silwood1]CAF3791149.1 unnamed protein product [Rotaria sp. Silwood1]CAF3821381.1 unnamed protein product [Rotaria sp. Silwood1]